MEHEEKSKVIQAMDKISFQMVREAQDTVEKLQKAGMPETVSWSAMVQSSVSALVGMEIIRLKTCLPSTDLGKISEHVFEMREKVCKALQDAVFEAAKNYDPLLARTRNVEWQDYLGEDFKGLR